MREGNPRRRVSLSLHQTLHKRCEKITKEEESCCQRSCEGSIIRSTAFVLPLYYRHVSIIENYCHEKRSSWWCSLEPCVSDDKPRQLQQPIFVRCIHAVPQSFSGSCCQWQCGLFLDDKATNSNGLYSDGKYAQPRIYQICSIGSHRVGESRRQWIFRAKE